jgi:hypothetical protein
LIFHSKNRVFSSEISFCLHQTKHIATGVVSAHRAVASRKSAMDEIIFHIAKFYSSATLQIP